MAESLPSKPPRHINKPIKISKIQKMALDNPVHLCYTIPNQQNDNATSNHPLLRRMKGSSLSPCRVSQPNQKRHLLVQETPRDGSTSKLLIPVRWSSPIVATLSEANKSATTSTTLTFYTGRVEGVVVFCWGKKQVSGVRCQVRVLSRISTAHEPDT